MKITVDNCIKVEKPTDAVLNYCKKALVFDNPDFYKKERLGKWTGNTPKQLYLYEKKGDTLVIPFGCLRDVWYLCPNADWDIKMLPIKGVEYGQGINLYSYQENAVESVLRVKNGVLVMPCGSGKGLPLDAKIYTPDGYKLNGDLQIGDKVIGSNGKETTVTGIFDKGSVDAYKITFSDETEIICDKDHLWTVQKQSQRHGNGKWWTESTENIYNHYKNIKRQDLYYIPVVKPVKFRAKKIPLNPWLLGFLIGDGCFQKTALSFSNSEEDLINKVKSLIFDKIEKKKGKNYDYLIYDNGNINAILKTLRLHNHRSYEKFIPEIYKYNSISVRLAVIQGLFDTDGYIAESGMFEYSTSSKQLANDFVEIVQSLGGTAKLHIKQPTYTYNGRKKVGRTSYRVFFKLYKFKPFTSEKHNAKFIQRTKYSKPYRIIKKIEPCEPIQSRCIAVDAKDELYVTDNFIVTHNTQCGLEIISRLGGRALWLTHTQDLLTQSMLRAKSIFDLPDECYGTITAGRVNIGTHITFATVQTMCKIDLEAHKNDFDIIITDECFPANTKITTKNGIKDLQNLRIDDIILSYNRYAEKFEYKKVKHLFKLKAHNIVKVKLDNGKEIITTSNHPFFTQKGEWVDAENLGGNDYVMRLVWQGIRRNKKTINNKKQNKKAWLWILFKRVCSQGWSQERCLDGRTQKKSCGNNEKNKREISRLFYRIIKKEKVDTRTKKANIGKVKSDRALSQNQMWKWSRAYSSSTKFVNRIIKAFRSLCRISDTHKNEKGKRLSYLLQGGYRNTRKYACNRSGRQFTLCNRTTTTRQKERQLFDWVRVDSVEVQKQTSDGTFGGLCPDGFVYNIEVEDNNNYFANGVLVHNCQHLVGSPTKVTQFYKVVSSLSARYKIGLTATPKRADGLENAMFAILGDVICEVDKNAIADYVCPVKVKKVHTGYTPDFEAIVGGDGTLDYMALIDDLISNEDRFKKVLETIEQLDGSAIVLANRVAYLQRLNECYSGRSVCLSGAGYTKKAKAERKAALEQLRCGDIDIVFSTYALASEGLDCPTLKYVVFATPEKNEVTVVQSVGRVGRKAEGKDFGTVIDFVDDFTMYENWSKQRDRFYKKIDAEVIY